MPFSSLLRVQFLRISCIVCLFVAVTYSATLTNGTWTNASALVSHALSNTQRNSPTSNATLTLAQWLRGQIQPDSFSSSSAYNIALLMCVAIVTLHVLRRTSYCKNYGGPMVATLVLALHPLLSQTVVWLPGRSDLLVTLCALGLIVLHMRDGLAARVGAVFSFSIALFVAPTALCLPVVLLAYDLTHRARLIRKWVRHHAGMAAVIVAYLVVRPAPGLHIPARATDWVQGYAFNMLTLLPRLVVPFENTALRPYVAPPLRVACAIACVVIAVTAVAIAFAARRTSPRTRAVAWGWIWFVFAMILPASTGPCAGALGDHVVCLPAIGMAIAVSSMVGYVVERLRSMDRSVIASVLCARVLCARVLCARVLCARVLLPAAIGSWWLCLAWQTAQRVQDWRSELTIVQAELRSNPNNSVAHRAMGAYLLGKGDSEAAYPSIIRALSIAPADWRAWRLLCLVELSRDRLPESEAGCRRSLRESDRDPDTWVVLADVLVRANRWTESASAARSALDLRPNDVDARYFLAVSLAGQDEWSEAVDEAHAVLVADPDHQGAKSLLQRLPSHSNGSSEEH